MLKRFLFPTNPNGVFISVILLAVRIVFGILMMNHGIDKWANYQELSTVFPDPLGIGSPLSLGLAIFGELACSMAFIIGFLYRLAMIPMIFTMCVAFFIIHGNDPFAVKELAFVYLVVFVLIGQWLGFVLETLPDTLRCSVNVRQECFQISAQTHRKLIA